MKTRIVLCAFAVLVSAFAVLGQQITPENATRQDRNPTIKYMWDRTEIVCAGIVRGSRPSGKMKRVRVIKRNVSDDPFEAEVWTAVVDVKKKLKGACADQITVEFYRKPIKGVITRLSGLDALNDGTYVLFLRKHGDRYVPARNAFLKYPVEPEAVKNSKVKTLADLCMASMASPDISGKMMSAHMETLSELVSNQESNAFAKRLLNSKSRRKQVIGAIALLSASDPDGLLSAIELAQECRVHHNVEIREMGKWIAYSLPSAFLEENIDDQSVEILCGLLKNPSSMMFEPALAALVEAKPPKSKLRVVQCLRRFPELPVKQQYMCIAIVSAIDKKSYGGGSPIEFQKDPKKYVRALLNRYPDTK